MGGIYNGKLGNFPLYHVDRRVRETGIVVDNGFEEVYANAEIKNNSDVSELMEVFVNTLYKSTLERVIIF